MEDENTVPSIFPISVAHAHPVLGTNDDQGWLRLGSPTRPFPPSSSFACFNAWIVAAAGEVELLGMAGRESASLLQPGGGYRLGGDENRVPRQRPVPSLGWGLTFIEEMEPRQRFNFVMFLVVGLFVFLTSSFASIGPLEQGLLLNSWTSYVNTEDSVGPGLHFVGLGKSYILFPTNQVSVIFTDVPAKGTVPDAGPIATRTGDDHGEVQLRDALGWNSC